MSDAGTFVTGLRRGLMRTRHFARHLMEPAVRKAAELHAVYEDLYWLRAGRARFREGWPPGHFYSPIPSLADVHRRDAEIFAVPDVIPGVDLNEGGQLSNLHELAAVSARHPYELTSQSRYSQDNPNFCLAEAIILHGIIRWIGPRRIIEIGCGYSSAVILDATDGLDAAPECTMIEPYPQLLRSLLRPGDLGRLRILECPLQEIATSLFEAMGEGDLLFIDSTHVAKTDSDVNHALHRVLPALAPGVWVHFHDIHFPFEYPRAWVYQGRAWNEAYALRAFLQYNDAFRIEFFNSWLWHFHRAELLDALPVCAADAGSSLWLRRV